MERRAERLLATKGTKEATIHGSKKKVSTLIVVAAGINNERSRYVVRSLLCGMSVNERSTSSVDASSEFCRETKSYEKNEGEPMTWSCF
jgi:hypothetical protein